MCEGWIGDAGVRQLFCWAFTERTCVCVHRRREWCYIVDWNGISRNFGYRYPFARTRSFVCGNRVQREPRVFPMYDTAVA